MNNTVMKWSPITTICLISALLTCTPAWAVVTSDTAGSHVVTPGESAFGVDLDGVGLMGFDWPGSTALDDFGLFCTGALITDRHLLTAAHCFDADRDGEIDADMVDGGIFGIEFPIAVGFELADRSVLLSIRTDIIRFPPQWPEMVADIAVVELAEAAPTDVPRYPIYSLRDEIGKQVVIAGYGLSGHGSSGAVFDLNANRRSGLNRYEALFFDSLLAYDFDSGLAENNSLVLDGFDSDLGFGADEVMMALGDSGGPSFVNGAIAGVHSVFSPYFSLIRGPEAHLSVL